MVLTSFPDVSGFYHLLHIHLVQYNTIKLIESTHLEGSSTSRALTCLSSLDFPLYRDRNLETFALTGTRADVLGFALAGRLAGAFALAQAGTQSIAPICTLAGAQLQVYIPVEDLVAVLQVGTCDAERVAVMAEEKQTSEA